MSILVRVAFAIACFLAISSPVRAQGFIERLVNPGPLVEGHAKFESECSKCHEAFSRTTQSRLCLGCHQEIAEDRAGRKGYHGRSSEALGGECRGCHTDHKGRAADITGLDRERFDHDVSEFRLVESHRRVDCASCHQPGRSFHKTPANCSDCHAKVDRHRGRLGTRCESCHTPESWRSVKPYDHGGTKFPLIGAHRQVACATCHAGEIYKDLPRTCISCHRIQDVHAGRYGPKCETCHDQSRWSGARFDHDATHFPLTGGHVSVRCDACHTGNLYGQKLAMTCVSCHSKQDPHKGALGERCETCHNTTDWRRAINFDHARTRFPLVGEHVSAPCEGCHLSRDYKEAPVQCEKCHQDTFHKGRLGAVPRCETCHNPASWRNWRYDHGKRTRFALTGAHARAACETCHSVRNPPSLKLPMACGSCHEDIHRGRLGARPNCAACHDTIAWSRWRFNHGQKTGFPLIGAHARVTCESCHTRRNAPSLKIATDCASCHRRDDPHSGSFGTACERCHTPVGWRRVQMRR